MKSIEFAEQYVGPIQDGAKTATVRVDECEAIEQGDRVRLVSETGQRFETARINATAETFVGGALHTIRALGAEYPAESTQALLDGLRHHYGPEIDGRTACRVLCWELVEACQPLVADGGDGPRAVADFLASLDDDPLAGAEERGGYALGTGPDSNPGRMLRHTARADL